MRTEADICLYGGAAGGGKLLDLDEPIPTPQGWTTMGALQAGDKIFSETGAICQVTLAHPVEERPERFRLEFDDGSQIHAGAEHLWLTFSAADLEAMTRRTDDFRARRRAARPSRATGRKGEAFSAAISLANASRGHNLAGSPSGAVRNTREIYETLRTPSGRANHAIQVCGALELPAASLPMDPYLLGLWLGDGTTVNSQITTADPEVVQAFEAEGFRVTKQRTAKYGWTVWGLRNVLRTVGVLGNKHVPPAYLRASAAQRLALLQGLMDSDGHACASGSVEFTNTNRRLAEAVMEIVVSLGAKTAISEGRATLRGKDCGSKFRLKWTAGLPAFRLVRKLAGQKREGLRRTTRFRYIVACEPAESRPMRCISVDSPSRLYLAGRTMIPTHNSFQLMLEAGRHISVPGFSWTIFRRSTPQITNQGALWDESYNIFPYMGGVPRNHDHSWNFPEWGTRGRFAHLEYEDTIYDYDGAQIPLIGFDQLEQFTEKQFFYMLTRNRTTCGVRPYVRATANPPPRRDHWLRALVDWWIDSEGYPIKERCGVLRYFVREDGKIRWVEKDYRDADGTGPKSFTFIAAKLSDNPKFVAKDPTYRANLKAQTLTDRMRLEKGNWNAVDVGNLFKRDWFEIIEPNAVPAGIRKLRYWDRAATKVSKKNPDPDFTAGALCGQGKGVLYIFDMQHFQDSPLGNETKIRQTADGDGRAIPIYMEEEGGASGKDMIDVYQRNVLRGYIVLGDRPTGDKETRAKGWCALAGRGNVKLVRGPWVHNFLAEVESYPNGKKDQVDAVSGAYKYLLGGKAGTIHDMVKD